MLILFFILFKLFIAISSDTIDGDYKILIFDENRSYYLEQNLRQSILWIQFQSITSPSKLFWLKIERKSSASYPILVKFSTKGHYNLSTTPLSTDCNFVTISHMMTHVDTEAVLVTESDYLPISLCDGLSGLASIQDDDNLVRIDTTSKGRQDTVHLSRIPKLSLGDLHKLNGYKQLRSIADRKIKRVKRSFRMPVQKLPGPFLVELYLVVDSKMATMYRDTNFSTLLSRITTILNQINLAFMQFNIYFTIVQLEIWEQDPIKLTDENHILMELQLYKRQFITLRHDCLHAILGENLGSAKRGQSEPATMCTYNRCVGYTKDYLGFKENEIAHSVIHELGHNFGLTHDTEDCNCYGCIMSTGVEHVILKLQWSDCSKRQISSLLKSGMSDCLKDSPHPKYGNIRPIVMFQNKKSKLLGDTSPSKCGNGVVDDDEQCDCGGREYCSKAASRCCDPDKCQLRSGAFCASGECCDLSLCSLKMASTVCRHDGSRDCDLPEYCDGVTEWCPSDVYKHDGATCTTTVTRDSSHCYHGQCQSRQSWCRVLFGDSGNDASSACYEMNRIGDKIKNCGLDVPKEDRSRQPEFWDTRPCSDEHVKCGRLWCNHFNERVLRSSLKIEIDETVGGHHCSAVRFFLDWYLDDAGLVPNGSPCGSGKMCWRGMCVSKSSIDTNGCYCYEHGVCNNRNHCHCNPGFAPPNCTTAGNGGSIDSGSPHKFNNSLRMVAIGVCICLVVGLTMVAIVVIVYHYNTHKWPGWLSKIKCPEYQKPEFIIASKQPNQFGNRDSKYIRCSIDQSKHSDNSLRSPRSPIHKFPNKTVYADIVYPISPSKRSIKTVFDNVSQDYKSPNFQNTQLKPPKLLSEKPVKRASVMKPLISVAKPLVSKEKPVIGSTAVSQIKNQFNQATKPPPLLSCKPTKTNVNTNSPNTSDSSKPCTNNHGVTRPPFLGAKPPKLNIVPPAPAVLSTKPAVQAQQSTNKPPNKVTAGTSAAIVKPANTTKIAKLHISQPTLDQTTCNTATRQISNPDQTLSRFVGPHKIIKIDANTAVKYLY